MTVPMNFRQDRRGYKRRLNNLRRKHRWGSYLFDCRYHPCRVVKTYYDDVDVVSLIDGTQGSCSLMNCISSDGPISKQLAEEAAAYHNEHGYYEFLKKYHGFNDEGIEWVKTFEKEWGINAAERPGTDRAPSDADQMDLDSSGSSGSAPDAAPDQRSSF